MDLGGRGLRGLVVASVVIVAATWILAAARPLGLTAGGVVSESGHTQASPETSPAAGEAATPDVATPILSTPTVIMVEVVDDDYAPPGVRVEVGSTVTWVNRDGVTHTVSAADGSFDSRAMHRGGIFAHTFTEPGTYPYECDLHLEMSGAVVVSGG